MENSNQYTLFFLLSLCIITNATAVPPEKELQYTSTQRTDFSVSQEYTTESARDCGVSMNFSNMNLHHIGFNFISSKHVKNLTLQNNNIEEFVAGAFDGLPNLEYLDLSRNKLSIDKLFSFGNHTNLYSLILDYNCGDVPCTPKMNTEDVGFDFYQRKRRSRQTGYYLDDDDDGGYIYRNNRFYNTRTTTTPKPTTTTQKPIIRHVLKLNESQSFPNLNYLSLRNIRMNILSHNWSKSFPSLNHLDISENEFYQPLDNIFNKIPSTTQNLVMENNGLTAVRNLPAKNLLYLNLNRNLFMTVSNHYCYDDTLCLQGLTSLIHLSISGCSIKKIESDAFRDTRYLLGLDLSNNRLEEISPDTFKYIPSLNQLDLSHNNFSIMPDFSALQNLSTLILNNMQNKTIFDSLELITPMPNLKVISLAKNEIATVPLQFFEKLPSLQEIDLSYNTIKSLSFWRTQYQLRNLYLNYNQISNIEDLSLREAKSLRILELKSNPIITVEIKALQLLPGETILNL